MKALTGLILSCIFSLAANAAVDSSAVSAKPPLLHTVEHVDLPQYLGKWYAIATIPQWFQKKCASHDMAEYSLLPNGVLKVLNSCQEKNGDITIADGRALPVDSTNAKLKVTFAHIFGKWFFTFSGQYWVVDLGPNYEYSIVGHPSRNYAWILSRTPSLDMTTLRQTENTLREQGYDTCKLLTVIQDGGFTTREPLCQVVKK